VEHDGLRRFRTARRDPVCGQAGNLLVVMLDLNARGAIQGVTG
jgi:hypothetical protein